MKVWIIWILWLSDIESINDVNILSIVEYTYNSYEINNDVYESRESNSPEQGGIHVCEGVWVYARKLQVIDQDTYWCTPYSGLTYL